MWGQPPSAVRRAQPDSSRSLDPKPKRARHAEPRPYVRIRLSTFCAISRAPAASCHKKFQYGGRATKTALAKPPRTTARRMSSSAQKIPRAAQESIEAMRHPTITTVSKLVEYYEKNLPMQHLSNRRALLEERHHRPTPKMTKYSASSASPTTFSDLAALNCKPDPARLHRSASPRTSTIIGKQHLQHHPD